MEGLKAADPGGYLPVLVVTAQPGHKLRALQAGAKDFVGKPFDLAEVLARVRNMLEVRLLHRELQSFTEVLETRVRERTTELQVSYLETIFALTRAAEHRDEETGAHVQRISYYCRDMAGRLGMDREFVERIFFSSPMHDIGKICVPDHILLKPGPLSPEEREIMKLHTTLGATILGSGRSPYLRMGAEIAQNHHERWDGGGYPGGRQGEAIPLTARIMSVCDIYDALRSKRPYKPAFDHMTAVDIMIHGDGRTVPEHFDPELISAFRLNDQSFRDIFESATATATPSPRS
jgi:putative two-component system response regulator